VSPHVASTSESLFANTGFELVRQRNNSTLSLKDIVAPRRPKAVVEISNFSDFERGKELDRYEHIKWDEYQIMTTI
jgi:hypothetical protein